MPRVFKEWSCGTSGTGDGLTEAEVLALAVKPDYEADENDADGILNLPDLSQSETFNVDKAAAGEYVQGVSHILWNGHQYILNTDAVLQAARGNTDTVDQTVLPSAGDGSSSSDWVVKDLDALCLTSSSAVSGVVIQSSIAPSFDSDFVVVGLGTLGAEFRKIASSSGTSVTVDIAFSNAHAEGDKILFLSENRVKTSWFNDATSSDVEYVQAAVDQAIEGTVVDFEGRTYAFTPTATTGSAAVLADTGATADAVDFYSVKLFNKRNIKLEGNGAQITSPRGYDFLYIYCENIEHTGFYHRGDVDVLDPATVVPANFEPAAVQLQFCFNASIHRNVISNQYRGVDSRLSSDVKIYDNHVSLTRYMGVALYGTLTNVPGWTLQNVFNDAFSIAPVGDRSRNDVYGNTIRQFSGVGIYLTSFGSAFGNVISTNYDSGQLPITFITGINVSTGLCSVENNDIRIPDSISGVLDGTISVVGVNVRFEDSLNAYSLRPRVCGNQIYGGMFSVQIAECRNAIVSMNQCAQYSKSGINIVASDVLGSDINGVDITHNVIANVNPATTASLTSYQWVGGITLSRDGDPEIIALNISDNTFDRKVSEIVDATARTNHAAAIVAYSKTADSITILPNNITPDSGHIRSATNSIYVGGGDASIKNVLATPYQMEVTGERDITLYVPATMGATVVNLPQYMSAGQTIRIVNLGTGNCVLFPFGAGYTIDGGSSKVVSPGVIAGLYVHQTLLGTDRYNVVSIN